MPRSSFALALAATLTACAPNANDPGEGGLTVGENQELDAAAAALDARPRAPQPPGTAQAPVNGTRPR